MAEGRLGPERVRSRQAAMLLAWYANVHRDRRRSRKAKPEDFDPYDTAARRRRTGMKVTRENWDWFVKAFTRGGRR